MENPWVVFDIMCWQGGGPAKLTVIWLEFDSQASKLPKSFGWMACVHRKGILQASLIPNPVVEMLSSGCDYGTMLSFFGLNESRWQ